ncbi:hypothetical protein GEMRC1_007073 [Eukaryota sp. GEM-RC1]
MNYHNQQHHQHQRQVTNVIIVKKLTSAVTHNDLRNAFSQYGTVVSCEVKKDNYDHPHQFATITFSSPIDFDKIEADFSNETLCGCHIRVQRARPRNEHLQTNIYIGNIPLSFTEENFTKECEKFGRIRSLKLVTSQDGVFQGKGFCEYTSAQEANSALTQLKNADWGAGKLEVNFKERYANHSSTGNSLFLRNIPASWNEDQLKALFEKVGPVSSATINRTDGNISIESGYVNFKHSAHATNAKFEFDGVFLDHRPLKVAFAKPRGQRIAESKSLSKPYISANPAPVATFQNHTVRQSPPVVVTPHVETPSNNTAPADQWKAEIEGMSEEDSVFFLTKRLFDKLKEKDSQHAPKIAGMFKELGLEELIKLNENEQYFEENYEEARTVLVNN